MDKCLGFGGVGDCFIVILKLLEYKRPFIYTHVDNDAGRLGASKKLLEMFNIPHECLLIDDKRQWWKENKPNYDKCFNVFAKGYIHIPKKSYHWEPCIDEGIKNPFPIELPEKIEYVAVQSHSSDIDRSYKRRPIVKYVSDHYNEDRVLWFGTDTEFNPGYGTNYCGKLDFAEALRKIAACKYFVGFPSVLFFWALYNKTKCYVFTDHTGRENLRIHDEWKKYITYDR